MAVNYTYTTDINANGTTVSAPVYGNGTPYYRLQGNGTDYIHKYASESVYRNVTVYLRIGLCYTIESDSCSGYWVTPKVRIEQVCNTNSSAGNGSAKISVLNPSSASGRKQAWLQYSTPWNSGTMNKTDPYDLPGGWELEGTGSITREIAYSNSFWISSQSISSITCEFALSLEFVQHLVLGRTHGPSQSLNLYDINLGNYRTLNKPTSWNSWAYTYIYGPDTRTYDNSYSGYKVY